MPGVLCLAPDRNADEIIIIFTYKGVKFPNMPSFGGEVKPSVPCRRFAESKRYINLRGIRNLGKITTGHLSRPQFHFSLLGSLASLRTEARDG